MAVVFVAVNSHFLPLFSSDIETTYSLIMPFCSSNSGGSQERKRVDEFSAWPITFRGGPLGAKERRIVVVKDLLVL